jgi:predicted MFS family arabinose efflux permease
MCSGLIVVPLNSLTQGRSRPAARGAVIAVLNSFVFAGILLGSVAGAVFGALGCRAPTIFLVAGGVALAGSVWARTARSKLEEPLPTPSGA